MISTKRCEQRNVSDYYVTPVWEIVKFLRWLEGKMPEAHSLLQESVLDPAAGGDERHEMSYPKALDLLDIYPKTLLTLDIREDSRAEVRGVDYLSYPTPKQEFSVIMTNPPFALAEEFVKKACKEVRVGGLVIMLLHLNFFGSIKRVSFWNSYPGMPRFVFVHSRRMSFTDDEYMHCVWQKGEEREMAELKVV